MLPDELSEREYDGAASELLLYRPRLESSVAEFDWNVPLVAQRFGASVEGTARALLTLDECVLTIWDNLEQTVQIGSASLAYPRDCMETERDTMLQCFELWEAQEARDELVKVRAWPVDPISGGIRRVVAFTWARAG